MIVALLIDRCPPRDPCAYDLVRAESRSRVADVTSPDDVREARIVQVVLGGVERLCPIDVGERLGLPVARCRRRRRCRAAPTSPAPGLGARDLCRRAGRSRSAPPSDVVQLGEHRSPALGCFRASCRRRSGTNTGLPLSRAGRAPGTRRPGSRRRSPARSGLKITCRSRRGLGAVHRDLAQRLLALDVADPHRGRDLGRRADQPDVDGVVGGTRLADVGRAVVAGSTRFAVPPANTPAMA